MIEVCGPRSQDGTWRLWKAPTKRPVSSFRQGRMCHVSRRDSCMAVECTHFWTFLHWNITLMITTTITTTIIKDSNKPPTTNKQHQTTKNQSATIKHRPHQPHEPRESNESHEPSTIKCIKCTLNVSSISQHQASNNFHQMDMAQNDWYSK